MPPKGSIDENKWVWLYWKTEGLNATCVFESDGKECGKKLVKSNGSCKHHLCSAHGLSKDSDHSLYQEKPSQLQQKLVVQNRLQLNRLELQAICHAANYWTFACAEDSWYRALTGTTTKRQELSQVTLSVFKKIRDAEIKKLNGTVATMLLDSGTVWDRCLAVILVTPFAKPMFWAAVFDDDFEDRKQTLEALRGIISDAVKECAAVGIKIFGAVSDNAANLSGAIEESVCLGARCGCHVLQLAANDVLLNRRSEIEFAEQVLSFAATNDFKQLHGVAPTFCETRWNSRFEQFSWIWENRDALGL